MLKKRVSEISLMNLDRFRTARSGSDPRSSWRASAGETIYQLVMPEDADAEQG